MSLTIHELLDASLIGSDDSEIAELDAIELNQIGPINLFSEGCELCFFALEIMRCQIEFFQFALPSILFISVL
jgi:hypothetical protein